MPMFDFTCQSCGHDFEEIQRIAKSGDREAVCPKCSGRATWRPSGTFGFRFTFKDGFDMCTGEYHPTKKHYEQTIREKGLVKID